MTKIDLINDAGRIKDADMSALYEEALNFVLANGAVLGSDSSLIDLAVSAAEGAGAAGAKQTLPQLQSLFSLYNDTRLRIAVLQAFASLGEGDSDIAQELNGFLERQLTLFESGTVIDTVVLAACIETLGELKNASSFQILFRAATGPLEQKYKDAAFNALAKLNADFKQNMIEVIKNDEPAKKLDAFRLSMRRTDLDDVSVGELAETALSVSLDQNNASAEDQKFLMELRYEAIKRVTAARWVKASPLAVRHFYQAQSDFRKGSIPLTRFIESIECLGAMGTAEAAQSLSIYLGLLNSEMEQTKNYNEQVMLAVIDALGALGDKSAFDYLLYIGYLDYPESVKKASRDALAGLKW